MTWPLDTTLVSLAQEQQVRVQYAFQFTSLQIDGAEWNYTSPSALSIFGDDYTPAVIKLSDNKEGGDGTATTSKFKIECEPLEPFISLIGRGLPFVWSVAVFEVYFDDEGNPNPWLVAEGQLTECSIEPGKMTLTFLLLSAWLDKKFPQPLFQTQDGRMPWDNLAFGVDLDEYVGTGTVNEVDQTILYSAAASAQPKDYYRMGFIAYQRTIGGQVVTLRYPIITNVPSTDSSHPEYGFFLLAAPPYLLTDNGDTFSLYPGYSGSRDQSIGQNIDDPGQPLGVLPTCNFFTRVLQTVGQITGASSTSAVTLNQAYPLYASAFTSFTAPSYCTIDQTVTPNTVTFTSTPASLNDVVEMDWPGTGASPNLGYRGFTEMAAWNPVTTSQIQAKAPPGPINVPAIDHFENGQHYPVSGATAGQTVWVIGSGFHGFNTGSAITVGGVAAVVTPGSWTDTQIEITVPSGLPLGIAAVAITSSNNSGNLQNQTTDPKLNMVAAGVITDYLDGNLDFITSSSIAQQIRVVGNGFGIASGTRWVVVNGVHAVINNWSADGTTIQVTVPNNTPYNTPAPITVHNSLITADIVGPNFTVTGTNANDLIDHFENEDDKPITSGTGEQEIRIVGAGFGAEQGYVYMAGIRLETTNQGQYLSWTDTLIVIEVIQPTTVPLTGPVSLTLNNGITTTGPNFYIGAAIGQPWIDHFQDNSPGGGNVITEANVGDIIYIMGVGFGDSRGTNGYVSFGGTQVTHTPTNNYLSWSDRIIKIRLESDLAGPPAAVIVNTDANVQASTDDYAGNFTVIS